MLSLVRTDSASAAEVARELGIAHASASYHLRQLLAAKFIEVVERRRVRGGVEVRYGLTDGAFDQLEGSDLLTEAMVAEITRRLARWRKDRVGVVSDGETWVDPHNWAQLVERARQLMADTVNLAVSRDTPGARRVSVTALFFEMDEAA
jgi:predicted ArsR family transcriptional regulator